MRPPAPWPRRGVRGGAPSRPAHPPPAVAPPALKPQSDHPSNLYWRAPKSLKSGGVWYKSRGGIQDGLLPAAGWSRGMAQPVHHLSQKIDLFKETTSRHM